METEYAWVFVGMNDTHGPFLGLAAALADAANYLGDNEGDFLVGPVTYPPRMFPDADAVIAAMCDAAANNGFEDNDNELFYLKDPSEAGWGVADAELADALNAWFDKHCAQTPTWTLFEDHCERLTAAELRERVGVIGA